MYGNMMLYFAFALPGMLLGMWAQRKIKSTFNKYASVTTARGYTGAQIARKLLDAYGLQNVAVERVPGALTDHYDPRGKVLRLSDSVYDSNSISAAGVAAHEMGHALQDAEGYSMLRLRRFMVPSVQLGSKVGPAMLFIGMLASQFVGTAIGYPIMWIGVIGFMIAAVFSLVTLPVEFDASSRAKKLLVSENFLSEQEVKGVDKVLDAAAWTYVAAAIQALGTVLYYIFLLTGGGNRRG